MAIRAENGHLSVLKYLADTFELTDDDVRSNDNYPLQCSTCNGHFNVLKYPHDKLNG